jgi:hypothetical protein
VPDLALPPAMRWWGWGDAAHPPALPAHALEFLRANVGLAPQPRPPVALERVRVEPTRLSAALLGELRGVV